MSTEYRYGIMCGLALSVWVLIEFALGFHTSSLEIGQYSGYFSMTVPVVFIYAALKEQRSSSNGVLFIKEMINAGFRIAIISAAIFTIFLYIYNNFINPDWITMTVEWQRKKLILGGASDDDIERFMEQNRQMNNSFGQLIITFIGITGIGIVITLAEIFMIKLLTKRKKSLP